ncbi:MAG: hypothetical protein GY874_15700, partial [Desulfobacteraceae bacterium]|nr:hypothetical protein [Desulfobacteraceae bacterium]
MHEKYCCMAKFISQYMPVHGGESVPSNALVPSARSVRSGNDLLALNTCNHVLTTQDVFANTEGNENDIYPPTVSEIAQAQKNDPKLKGLFRKGPEIKDISVKVIDETDILVYKNKRLVIPDSMQSQVVQWYHHYLMHPGAVRLEETLRAAMYWKNLTRDVKQHVKSCKNCQIGKKRKRKYGELPPKIAITEPWKCVCVDLIGPYTLKGKDGTILDFMCLTMMDP